MAEAARKPYRALRGDRPSDISASDSPRSRWQDMLMAALPCVTMLLLMFAPQTGTGNLIVFMGLTALAFFPVPLVPWRRISASWPIMLFPLLALASASWSIDPTTSIRLAIELSITMLAGIIIGSSERRSTIILSTAIGLAIYFMIAMGLGRSVGWGADGDTAFAGLADSKNYFGDMCALVFVASVSIFLLAMMKALRVRIVVMIVCVLLWPLTIGGVLASHSSGALLGIGVAVLVAGTAAVYTWISGSGRIVMMAVLLVTGAIVGGLSISQSNVLNDLVLRSFKKDSTLTGRAYLWYRGDQIIKKQPALGLGYGAFWVQGNADAEGLWRYNHIDDRGGFNFHNTVRDLRVSMGLLGLTLFLLIVLAGIGGLVVAILYAPLPYDIFWISTVAYQAARLGFESITPTPFSYVTVLLTAATAYGGHRIVSVLSDRRTNDWRRRHRPAD